MPSNFWAKSTKAYSSLKTRSYAWLKKLMVDGTLKIGWNFSRLGSMRPFLPWSFSLIVVLWVCSRFWKLLPRPPTKRVSKISMTSRLKSILFSKAKSSFRSYSLDLTVPWAGASLKMNSYLNLEPQRFFNFSELLFPSLSTLKTRSDCRVRWSSVLKSHLRLFTIWRISVSSLDFSSFPKRPSIIKKKFSLACCSRVIPQPRMSSR